MFLSVFDTPKTTLVTPKRDHYNGFWSIFGPKNMVPNHSRTNAELLEVIWSMHDVCEAQKMCFSDANTAFIMGFEIFKRSYLKIFSQNGAVVWVTRVVPGILGVCLSMFEYV